MGFSTFSNCDFPESLFISVYYLPFSFTAFPFHLGLGLLLCKLYINIAYLQIPYVWSQGQCCMQFDEHLNFWNSVAFILTRTKRQSWIPSLVMNLHLLKDRLKWGKIHSFAEDLQLCFCFIISSNDRSYMLKKPVLKHAMESKF